MKLSSSTLCGCCFCCYCHCWLMMLLMVSSVVHVSPEMSTTITATTKKFTKLNNNHNNNNNINNYNNINDMNYAYPSTMAEIENFNKKTTTNRTTTTTTETTKKSLLTTPSSLPQLPAIIRTTKTTTTINPTAPIVDNQYKENEVNSYRRRRKGRSEKEHEVITINATKQKQSIETAAAATTAAAAAAAAVTMQSTSKVHATLPPAPPAIIMTTTTTETILPAPEQIQIKMTTKQKNPHVTTTTRTAAASSTIQINTEVEEARISRRKRQEEHEEHEEHVEDNDVLYTYDNSIENVARIEKQPATSRTIPTTTTTTNYVADNSNAIVSQTTWSRIGEAHSKTSKNKKKTHVEIANSIGANSIDLSRNLKLLQQQQQQQLAVMRVSSGNSDSTTTTNNDNSNINNNSNNNIIQRQKTTNTFSLNSSNNRYGTAAAATVNNNGNINQQQQEQQNLHMTTEMPANGTLKALELTTSTSSNQTTTTTTPTSSTSSSSSSSSPSPRRTAAINLLPANTNDSSDYRKSITHKFKSHSNKSIVTKEKTITTATATATSTSTFTSASSVADSFSYSKEIKPYSSDTHHYQQLHQQIPATTLATTQALLPMTTRTTAAATALAASTDVMALASYSPLHEHQYHSQMKEPMLLHRHARQAATDDEQNEKCRMFVEGDPEKNELYSPDYPNDYPKNINCTRVITAPKGQIIRLDFRNSFHIEEKEECKFDFLEIRDGQYGFSNLIGKYCGTDFPPEITSKERYLWLHFHSDESIEYSGFTAVYEFIDRNRDAPSTDLNCTIEKDGFEGFINASDVPKELKDTVVRNKIPLDCMWRIQVKDKWKIQVKFVDFKLAKPNDCETNFLDIFPEQTVMPLRVKNFCGSAGEGITSESNILHMRFYAEQVAINSSFSILYTAFRDRGSSSCAADEYDCEDATCISSELLCNGRDNCKFRWDEESCEPDNKGQSEHMIIIITVFGLILGGMVITFLVNCVRKIMHDQKIIREIPVLSDGIYHIDSFILDAPKAVICVGLQDDYKLSYRTGYEHDYPASGHDNIMSIEGDDDGNNSLTASCDDIYSYSTQSEYKNSIDSIEIHENCCSAHNNCQLNEMHNAKALAADGIDVADVDDDDDTHDEMKHVFDNDEFIIVPHVAQTQLITSHCNVHSGLMILAPPENGTTPLTTTITTTTTTTSDSCNSSPAPSSCTANTTNSSADSNYIAMHNGVPATGNGSALTTSCYRDDMLHFQCLMQKCAH